MATKNEGQPGMMELARSLVRAPLERRLLSEAQNRYDRLELEAATLLMERSVSMVQPETDGWVPVFGGDGRVLGDGDATTLRSQAIKAAYRSPLLGGYLKTLKRFVIGVGPTFYPDTKDEKLRDAMRSWWRKFVALNQWYDMEDEFVTRTWRDGETFLRQFVHTTDGPVAYSLTQVQRRALANMSGFVPESLRAIEAPKGMTFYRLLDPDQIRDPSGTFKEGIVVSADDVRHVLGYVWTPNSAQPKPTWIPAAEMLHSKIGVDLDILRGRSILEILLQRDKQYEDWVRYRIALSMYRSSVVMVRKLTNVNATAVQAVRDRQAAQRDDSGNDARVRMPKPGTTVTAGPNLAYEFMSPNLQAQDAQHDGRMLMLSMAAGAGIPEYMFTGDSSNANYSSTLVSEGPAFREFRGWQDYFTPREERVWRTVFQNAIDGGAFRDRMTRKDLESMEVKVQWPNIEVRDEVKHTTANRIKKDGGILSDRTWATDEGLDYDAEMEQVDQQMLRELERLGALPASTDDGTAGDEG